MARKVRETKVQDSKIRDYELVYIVNPDIDEEALSTRIDGISQFISGKEGVVSDVQKWGKKKLAYPIKHFLEGHYVLTRFQLSPARCQELDSNLKISEEILRHLLIKVE